MHNLKPLSPDAIQAALDKAHHYRLLNEPTEVQSICLDVLEIEPENQRALVLLLLSWTDRFEHGGAPLFAAARAVVPRLESAYMQAYYGGIVLERWAKAKLNRGGVGASEGVHDLLRQAMERFEEAIGIGKPGDDEAVLRWNTCARLMDERLELESSPLDQHDQLLE